MYSYNQPNGIPSRAPRQSIWGRFRGWNRFVQIAISIVLFASCSLCSLVVLGIIVGPPPVSKMVISVTSTSTTRAANVITPTQPPIVPTVVATKAAGIVSTNIPITVGTPILGASIGTFVARYGKPNDHSDIAHGSYHFARYANTSVATDGIIVTTDYFDTGMADKVFGIVYAPENGKISCAQFMPDDAKYQSETIITTGTGNDKIYYSASLTKIFPASSFTDVNNNPTKPGLFDIQTLMRADGTTDSCNIQLGTQQTQ